MYCTAAVPLVMLWMISNGETGGPKRETYQRNKADNRNHHHSVGSDLRRNRQDRTHTQVGTKPHVHCALAVMMMADEIERDDDVWMCDVDVMCGCVSLRVAANGRTLSIPVMVSRILSQEEY